MRLWRALLGQQKTQEIARYSVNQYANDLALAYNGHRYLLSGGSAGYNKTEDIETSFTGYVSGLYKSNGIVFAIILARMLLFCEARFAWFEINENGDDGKPKGRDGLDVLERPWPNGGTGELLARMEQDVSLGGNFYAVRDGSRLRRLRPDWVTIVLTAPPAESSESEVAGYWYHPGRTFSNAGEPARGDDVYLPGEVCHWSPLPDPDAQYRGMSWLAPVLREVMADKSAMEHKLNFFTNGATFGAIVSAKESLTNTQYKEWKANFEGIHSGAGNAYKTLFLASPVDTSVTTANMQQLDFKVTVGAGETRLCAAGGVPPIIVGLSEGLASATYSNYGMARRKFGDHWAHPQWKSASQALSSLVDAPGEDLRLGVNTKGIAFLREDAKDLATIQQIKASTLSTLIMGGFTPESSVAAVEAEDLSLLEHTGLTSVQLVPPGTAEGSPEDEAAGEEYDALLGEEEDLGEEEAERARRLDDEIVRKFNPRQPRDWRGRWTLVGAVIAALKAQGGEQGGAYFDTGRYFDWSDYDPDEGTYSFEVGAADQDSVQLELDDSEMERLFSTLSVTRLRDTRAGESTPQMAALTTVGETDGVAFGDEGERGYLDWSGRTADGGYGFEVGGGGVVVTLDLSPAEMDKLIASLALSTQTEQAVEEARSRVERARYNIRNPEGSVGGGRFRKLSDAIVALLRDSDGGDPLEDFSQPQLKKAAEQLGLTEPRKRYTAKQLKLMLATHVRGDKAPARPAKKAAAPARKATFDPREVADRLAEQRSQAAMIRLLASDPSLTSAKLRRVAEEMGIDVPDNIKAKTSLQLHIAEAASRDLPSDLDAPDSVSQARQRQADIDSARRYADVASVLDELSANEATDDVVAARIRSLARRHGIADESDIEGIAEAVASGQRDFARLRAENVLMSHGITQNGAAGDTGRFTPSLHRPISGSIRQGAPVEVVRPGFTLDRDGERIRLSPAVVEEVDPPATPEPKKPAAKKAPARKAPAKKAAPGGDEAGASLGRDLTASLDYDAIDAGDHSTPGADKRLARIQQQQGFDGPARQVDEAEWERLSAEGGTPIYRGVRGRKGGPSAEDVARGYAEGDFSPARGNYGSGSYFVSSRDTADKYASGEAFGGAVFEGGDAFEGGATVEAMLLPDARVLDWDASERLRQEVAGLGPHDMPGTARERVLADEGRMAAALGYDAVRVHLGEPYGDEVIVLNRTATAVRAPDTTPDPLSSLRTLDPEAARDALDLRKVEGDDGLKALLRSAGLPVSGRKRELVDRLVGHLHPQSDVSPELRREIEIENRIRAAFRARLAKNGKRPKIETGYTEWVGLAELREELGDDIPRAEVDAALIRMGRGDYPHDGHYLVPEDNQKALRQIDRDAAVQMGGKANHALTIDDPSDRPLPGHLHPGDSPTAPGRRAEFNAADVAEQITLRTPRATEDEIVAALEGYTVPQLRRIATQLNLRFPRELEMRPDGLPSGRFGKELPMTPDERRRYIAQNIVRDRARWSLRSEMPDEDDIERADYEDEPEGGDPGEPDEEQRARAQTRMDEIDDEDDEPEDEYDAYRAAGIDTHPGGERLHLYWIKGAGLRRWAGSPHPWTALYRHLTKHVGAARAKRMASAWFHEVFGIWSGERKGDNPVGPG